MTAKKITRNVFYIPGATNVGVISVNGKRGSKTKDVYLVDSGGDSEDAERIFSELNELFPLENGGFNLVAIINTHSHADHCGGNDFFVKKTGCQVWCSRIESVGLECSLLQSIITCGSMPLPHLQSSYYVAKPSKADKFIDENSEIKLRGGGKISFISLPGHYLDMLGVLFTDKNGETVFFPGDAVFGRMHVLKYWISYLVDLGAFKQTLEKLDKTNFNWYIPCHGEAIRRIQETVEMNKIAVLSTEYCILRALKDERRLTFSELMKAVADMNDIKLRTPQYLLIGSTIRAYLYYLYQENKIDCAMKENQLFWFKAKDFVL